MTEAWQVQQMRKFIEEHEELYEELAAIEDKHERSVNLINNYLATCFNYQSCAAALNPLIDEDEDLPMDIEYIHVCTTCTKPTLYSSKGLVEHQYGPWCLEQPCMEKMLDKLM